MADETPSYSNFDVSRDGTKGTASRPVFHGEQEYAIISESIFWKVPWSTKTTVAAFDF